MCGIAGIVDWKRTQNDAALARTATAMAARIRHRGPDADACWSNADEGVGFAHRRLSIIDLSVLGRQPMHSACGRYVLTYNGEFYNYRAVRAELEARGIRFKGQSDSEVLLEAIACWGLKPALQRAVGMFALALWDRRERCLSLARDRLGIKPLIFTRLKSGLAFASELRALNAVPDFTPEMDRNALSVYLARNCIPAPLTIYRQAQKLRPGEIITFDAAGPDGRSEFFWRLKQVWEAGRHAPFEGPEETALEELESVLSQAVRERMVADVPLGVFLSGGVDSSLVTALMQQASSRPVKSYAIGFGDAQYDESKDAAKVAHHLGTDHTTLEVSPAEALAVVPRLGTLYDEPFSDSSQIPTYLVSKMARADVTVALSGDGGDEIFAGYNRYMWAGRVHDWNVRLPMPLRKGLHRLAPLAPPKIVNPLSRLIGHRNAGDKLQRMLSLVTAKDEVDIYRRLVTHWPEEDKLVIGGAHPGGLLDRPEEWPETGSFVETMMYLDAMTYLPDDILTKVDRASMAVSLEARVPLLDHRVIAFAARLPLSMKQRQNTSKWALRQILYKHVPKTLIERPKMGFAIPLDAWLRGPLRDWAEALLDPKRLREQGLLRPDPIRKTWQAHLSGRQNLQHQLWDILMLQAWWDAEKAPPLSQAA